MNIKSIRLEHETLPISIKRVHDSELTHPKEKPSKLRQYESCKHKNSPLFPPPPPKKKNISPFTKMPLAYYILCTQSDLGSNKT